MNFRRHLYAGSIASAAVTVGYGLATSDFNLPFTTDPGDAALVFVVCLAGSLAPDLDTHSVPSKITSFLVSIFCAFSIYHKEPYPALIIATALLFIKSLSHRGWVHTYTIALVVGLFGIIPDLWLLIPFAIGMIVHFKTDSMLFLKKTNWIKPIKFF
jgi:uncharacterized metal-binding protein